ncbi:MAG: aldo/keto reductase [Candidatus Dactylopiibacterium sp.]|nr:aldo/keto reductase [Candidatus Dactylopiibacterium sp.]
MDRQAFLKLAAGLAASAVAAPVLGQGGDAPRVLARRIPSSGEALPVIGCGTYVGFDVAPGAPAYAQLPGVLARLFEAGAAVIDSSPMYGRAEQTAGELLAAHPGRGFVATKVWTRGREAGIAQMEESMRLLRRARLDLMQVHNLLDWRVHLATLRAWQAQGRVRYVGVTHYTESAYAELETVMRREKLDFVQVNHSIAEPAAARRILPLAAERGMAVIINRPFGGGGLMRRLAGQPLPGWAAEIGATSWAQVLLKYVLAHPGATCAIPGTRRAEHMADNLRAGSGELPGPDFWRGRLSDIPV